MPIELQAKLLRVLEDGIIRRVGSSQNISVNVRVIAAMNVHPQIALQEKLIRHDLYYRLNVFAFSLLPLRERKEDILYLTDFFIQDFNRQLSKTIRGVDKKLEIFLTGYQWPGNVRELKHTLEYMMNVCEGTILEVIDLPVIMKHYPAFANGKHHPPVNLSLRKNLEEVERKLINSALDISKGNIKQAAKLLEIPRQTLQYKLKKISD